MSHSTVPRSEFIAEIFAQAADLSGEDLVRRRTAKALGELAEHAFAFKAATLGFGISKPVGDNEPFDFVVNAGHRLWRVQVKSTYSAGKSGAYFFRAVRAAVGGRLRVYSPADIDVLAGWVMPLDVWYIIPVAAFAPRKSIAIYPHREPEAGQFEPFREAWCLLACSQENVTDNRILIDRCPASDGVSRQPCPLKDVLANLESKAPTRR